MNLIEATFTNHSVVNSVKGQNIGLDYSSNKCTSLVTLILALKHQTFQLKFLNVFFCFLCLKMKSSSEYFVSIFFSFFCFLHHSCSLFSVHEKINTETKKSCNHSKNENKQIFIDWFGSFRIFKVFNYVIFWMICNQGLT